MLGDERTPSFLENLLVAALDGALHYDVGEDTSH